LSKNQDKNLNNKQLFVQHFKSQIFSLAILIELSYFCKPYLFLCKLSAILIINVEKITMKGSTSREFFAMQAQGLVWFLFSQPRMRIKQACVPYKKEYRGKQSASRKCE